MSSMYIVSPALPPGAKSSLSLSLRMASPKRPLFQSVQETEALNYDNARNAAGIANDAVHKRQRISRTGSWISGNSGDTAEADVGRANAPAADIPSSDEAHIGPSSTHASEYGAHAGLHTKYDLSLWC